ncbi:hypothetical protein NCCP2716_07820 [Sporosarcina sp. NCCP-2716]|uniref:DUF4064 domain-containing protein n=1 Tax=Sporosarcina sp. NCCP-2716 TaxID=2943679 RepID=UPI00203D7705|nr:DUF4064 domain-containing protein [Sporosarcina sp. NCCP-2716]GKV68284.1 hypothetical protein NCCP2716_07820 [Sporosarcina sp. NCCP-2716]
MSRTAERVLGIIGIVFTVISIAGGIFGAVIFRMMNTNAEFRQELEMDFYSDPAMTQGDIDMIFNILDGLGGFLWLLVVFCIISLVLNIIALIKIWNNKNPKLAGILFILAGLTGGILTLTSILLYIAGIMCLTRKETLPPGAYHDPVITDTPPSEDGMRPL